MNNEDIKQPKIPKIQNVALRRVSGLYMDEFHYNLIKIWLKAGWTKEKIQKTLGDKIPKFWSKYKAYEYSKEKFQQDKENRVFLQEKLNDMTDFNKMVVNVNKDKRGKTKKDEKQWFDYLDENIEAICELIYMTVPPPRIVDKLNKEYNGLLGLTYMCFNRWTLCTKNSEELALAAKASGEVHIHAGLEFMKDWLNREELDMKHAAIIREIGNYHSRMAAFYDQKKWGKVIHLEEGKKEQKFISGENLREALSGLAEIADKFNGGKIKEDEDGDGRVSFGDDEIYSDFEEIKD